MKKEMTYNIFLDDKLRPFDIYCKTNNREYKEKQFVVVKSKEQFVSYIEEQFKKDGSYPSFISFDYQLADVVMQVTEDYSIHYGEETYTPDGVECAEWILEFCKINNLPVPKYFIHDTNTTGKRFINKVFGLVSTPTPVIRVPDPFTKIESEKERGISITIEPKEIEVKQKVEKVEKPKKTEKVEKPKKAEKEKVKKPKKAEKIKKPSDKEFIINTLKDSLSKKNLSKMEINEILVPQMSDKYTPTQKNTRIENIMYELTLKNVIVNTGTVRVPSWKLI